MVLAMGGVTAFAAEADDIKAAINDPHLEAAIIEAVGGEENLTGVNIRQIKNLSVAGKGIQDLQGIQMLTGLETLDLSGNKLEVIAQLGDLKGSLKSLNLSDNLIKETGPLSLLTNLTSLDVSGNLIEDGGGIANLTGLTTLNIADNKIVDSGAFEKLTNLTSLDVSGNQIKDAGGIAPLTKLETLNLSGNQIEDTGALETLANLKTLDLSGNQIADLGGLEKAGMNLTTLNIANNKVEELYPLFGMTNLTTLNLDGNMVPAEMLDQLPSSITEAPGFADWKEATLQTQNVSYIITVTVGENGTVTPYGNEGKVTVKNQDDQSFTIQPAEGYVVDKVLADGVDVTGEVKDGVYTFAKVGAAHTLEVTFKAAASAEPTPTPTPDLPQTGEHGTALPMMLFIAGAGVLVASLALRKRNA